MTNVCNCQGCYKDQRGGALYLGLFLLGQSLRGFPLLGLQGLFTALVCFLDVRPAGLRQSSRSFWRALSAFSLWMHSVRTCLLLNTLPFIFTYGLWSVWQSVFLYSQCLPCSWHRILTLLIQATFSGMWALAILFHLPVLICLPTGRPWCLASI